ncbi:MAG: hypothetical protein NTX49_07195 [Chlamydiae bacterium]|nr:hypothetical protein [Chlamydiota bacterium]
MTQPIGTSNRQGFLSFSIIAKVEYSLVAKAATKIRAGNISPCRMEPFYWERYVELRQEFKKIEDQSIGDFDFGAGGTLKEMKAALRVIHTACKKP